MFSSAKNVFSGYVDEIRTLKEKKILLWIIYTL